MSASTEGRGAGDNPEPAVKCNGLAEQLHVGLVTPPPWLLPLCRLALSLRHVGLRYVELSSTVASPSASLKSRVHTCVSKSSVRVGNAEGGTTHQLH